MAFTLLLLQVTVLPPPKEKLLIMLVNTRVARDTKAMVARVRNRCRPSPYIANTIQLSQNCTLTIPKL